MGAPERRSGSAGPLYDVELRQERPFEARPWLRLFFLSLKWRGLSAKRGPLPVHTLKAPPVLVPNTDVKLQRARIVLWYESTREVRVTGGSLSCSCCVGAPLWGSFLSHLWRSEVVDGSGCVVVGVGVMFSLGDGRDGRS